MKWDESLLRRENNNFDLLRLGAALMVFVGHSPLVLGRSELNPDPINWLFGHATHAFGVVIFFILSGFLVSHSWERRTSLLDFFKARVLRIYPALIVVVLLSVLVIGPLCTKFSWAEYFGNERTYKYLANASLFRITYLLPGVFEANPLAGSVNASLWSLPYEFFCYLLLAGLALLLPGRRIGKYFWPILMLVLCLAYIIWEKEMNQWYWKLIDIKGSVLFPYLLYFLSGSAYYHLRKHLRWHWSQALMVLGACLMIKLFDFNDLLNTLLIPYLVIYLGVFQKWTWKFYERMGDLSYGIYLYAFLIQQILLNFVPEIQSTWVLMGGSFPLIFLLAWASYRWIERPALSLK
ncbi:MAG: acyltransferase [Bacteroidetes bacterium]|nr:MAG: acyltransferase [Bacteroidota bacterium]